jgi:hypothetical protein
MALIKLEDIKKLLDENKINLKDLEKVSELEEIKKKNEKIVEMLDKFEKMVNNKKMSATKVSEILDNITAILKENLPKRKARKSTSTPEKEEIKVEITDEKVENVENHKEIENNQNL